MQTGPHKATPNRGCIYTLAQTGTALKPIQKVRPVKTVKGNGTDATQPVDLAKRARRKLITQKGVLHLIEVAKLRGESDRIKAYWNTYHCQSKVIKANNRIYGDYCKNRFCTVCSDIRKAEKINRYLPVIEKWKDPRLVTLTAKAVSHKELNKQIEKVLNAFRVIVQRYKKRHQRGKGPKLMGVKSIECNFNPQTNTYNPHLHILVPDLATAKILQFAWLEYWGPAIARHGGQRITLVKNTERALIEVIKYASKIFTDPNMKKKHGPNKDATFYAQAYHNIIWALEGHRVFERFGFNLPKTNKPKGGKRTTVTEYEELIFDGTQFDWVNPATGEIFTGYIPEPQLIEILENNIDTEAQ
jgi:hypothetical protein